MTVEPRTFTLPEYHTGQEINVWVTGSPAPKGSRAPYIDRFGHARTVESSAKREKAWRRAVETYTAAEKARTKFKILTGPCQLSLIFYRNPPVRPQWKREGFPDTTPDADKLARSVADALSGILYEDDKLIVNLSVWKRFGTPGCAVTLLEMIEDAKPRRK